MGQVTVRGALVVPIFEGLAEFLGAPDFCRGSVGGCGGLGHHTGPQFRIGA